MSFSPTLGKSRRKKVCSFFRVFSKNKTSLLSSRCPPTLSETTVTNIPVDAAGVEEKRHDQDAIHLQYSPKTSKEDLSMSWHEMKTSLRLIEKSVDASAPFKSAVRGLIVCFNLTQVVAENDEEYENLATDITSMAKTLVSHIPKLVEEGASGSVARILKSLEQEMVHIWQQENWDDMRSIITQQSPDLQEREYTIRQYRRIKLLIHQLHSDIGLRNWDAIREPRNIELLENIFPVDDARYNSSYSRTIDRHECAITTCKRILDYLKYWAGLPEGAKEPRVFWMTGTSGTGKTTISYSFCKWLEENGQLGGNYFCSHTSPLCRNINNVVPTLAYQLSQYSPAFRSALCEALKGLDDSELDINTQFEKLLQKPMETTRTAFPENVVIVIDALDECDTEISSRLFINTLMRLQSNLPIKFFVASRPEHVIGEKILASGYGRSTLHLHDIIDKSVEDIETYLTEALGFMSPLSPTKNVEVEQLAQRAGKLFIYAATVVRYIHPNGFDAGSGLRLQVLLGMVSGPNKQHNELDKLYSSIISLAVNPELREEQEVNNTLLILRTVVGAKEPMAVATLASLLRLPVKRIHFLLKPLRSLLHVQHEGLVVPFHISFSDFLSDKQRSGEFNRETTSVIDTSVTPTTSSLPIPFRESSYKYYQDSDVRNLTDQIQKLGEWPYAHGGYADIWQAVWQNGSQSVQVAVKVLRVLNQDVEVKKKVLKRLRMEVRVWHQLRHRHIVPMFGICEEFGEFPSMVSAWYDNGHVMAYLQKLGEMATVEKRLRLLIDVACGLDYLHTFPFPLNGANIIHGDLKGANILVNTNGEAALADFGLSAVIAVAGQSTSTLTSNACGSIRWMAPELLSPSEGAVKTRTSDIYSFGSVILEVLTGENPYKNLMNDVQVITALHRRIKPERPAEPLLDPVWDLMERCWSNKPRDRPSMSVVLSNLEKYYEERNMSLSHE